MTATVDLHLHSCHSDDGELAPADLIRAAADAGLRLVALADHNAVSGVDEALRAGAAWGVRVIPAVEADCRFRDRDLHVLGYGIDHRDRRWVELEERVVAMEQAASGRRLDAVEALGIRVDREAVAAASRHGVVIPETIAAVALADPANRESALLAPYRPGGARSDNPCVNFYWDHCAQGKPAHVPLRHMDFADAIDHIHNTGGVAVLAHPGAVLRGGEELLPELVAAGIAGVEAFSSYHTSEECAAWRERAVAAGAFVTCGSDYHGTTKPAIQLGGHGVTPRDEADAAAALKPYEKRGAI